jgi:hypothetical protein
MAQSRAEIRRLLERPPRLAATDAPGGAAEAADGGVFPRSRTMRLLLSGRGIGTVGAVLGGLLVARPALAIRAIRLVPLGAVARMLVVKGLASFRRSGRRGS